MSGWMLTEIRRTENLIQQTFVWKLFEDFIPQSSMHSNQINQTSPKMRSKNPARRFRQSAFILMMSLPSYGFLLPGATSRDRHCIIKTNFHHSNRQTGKTCCLYSESNTDNFPSSNSIWILPPREQQIFFSQNHNQNHHQQFPISNTPELDDLFANLIPRIHSISATIQKNCRQHSFFSSCYLFCLLLLLVVVLVRTKVFSKTVRKLLRGEIVMCTWANSVQVSGFRILEFWYSGVPLNR